MRSIIVKDSELFGKLIEKWMNSYTDKNRPRWYSDNADDNKNGRYLLTYLMKEIHENFGILCKVYDHGDYVEVIASDDNDYVKLSMLVV